MTALDGDPFAFPEGPKYVTRDDLVELGALAVAMTDAWTDGDREPIAPQFGDTSHREVMIDLACTVLDAAYPQFESAEELDVLAVGAVIVSQHGEMRRKIARKRSAYCWIQGDTDISHGYGQSCANLANPALGRVWTLVFRGQR